MFCIYKIDCTLNTVLCLFCQTLTNNASAYFQRSAMYGIIFNNKLYSCNYFICFNQATKWYFVDYTLQYFGFNGA